MSKKPKETVEARRSHTNMVLEARRSAVKLTQELHNTMQALRHSNAVCAYLLTLMRDKADSGVAYRIPLADYKKLLADDATGIRIEYTEAEAIVRLTAAADLTEPVAVPLRTTHLAGAPRSFGDTRPVGNVTVTDKAAPK